MSFDFTALAGSISGNTSKAKASTADSLGHGLIAWRETTTGSFHVFTPTHEWASVAGITLILSIHVWMASTAISNRKRMLLGSSVGCEENRKEIRRDLAIDQTKGGSGCGAGHRWCYLQSFFHQEPWAIPTK